MNTKIIIASLIVSLILAAAAALTQIGTLLPNYLSFFIIAFVSACLSCFWVTRVPSSKPKKKAHKPGKPINGNVKENGKVKWFNASKGFGFITRDGGEDIFVHFRSILGEGHRVLQEGQKVEFLVTNGDKGLQAEEVSPLKG